MERRLTKRNQRGIWTVYKGDGSVSFSGEHVNLLAKYEDTGYTPEEIAKITSIGQDLQSLVHCIDELEAYRAFGYDLHSLSSCMAELNAYRNSGLSPEEAAAIGQAQRDGRIKALPCRVGDEVYMIIERVTGRLGIIQSTCNGFDDTGVFVLCGDIIPYTEFGRSAFLTLEEAEAAIEPPE